MATRPVTNAERLTRIETILERMEPKVASEFYDLRLEMKAMRIEMNADKADLAALKNRGAGILVGVSVLSAVLGNKLQAIVHAVASMFR